MKQKLRQYSANGKLLLTGEYMVMYGARSLAVPLKFGQMMGVSDFHENELQWIANAEGNQWFTALFSLPSLDIKITSDNAKAVFLSGLLRAAQRLNSDFLNSGQGYKVTTNLNYPQQWGLGSSSTLIYLIAQWSGTDAMKLHRNVSGGSGYDVACAGADRPLVYQVQGDGSVWNEIQYHPPFSENLYFVYLGHKQDTQVSIRNFREMYRFNESHVTYISKLTGDFLEAVSLREVMEVINEHERFLSELLGCSAVKTRYFNDFDGGIKSLGAWGGDFVLAATELKRSEALSYFAAKGFAPVFSYGSIIRNRTE